MSSVGTGDLESSESYCRGITDAMKPYLQGYFSVILICLTSLFVQGESREIPQDQDCELIQDDGNNNSSQISINGTNSDHIKLCFKLGNLQV
ncbi:unnamed protein product [Timema podura]|uniref:Uncharacterized protein n=1 Tax=Timema podura TaxID=61482 RepID=A0ABN7P013_TIMPD|nr:unnamed protein product [Timema podura]